VDACLAYLMLAQVRGCEERRAMMRRIAIGEVTPPCRSGGDESASERPEPRSCAPSFRPETTGGRDEAAFAHRSVDGKNSRGKP
jgi:hypothetical protein